MKESNKGLSAIQKIFWLLDQVSQVHFSMAAELNIVETKTAWQSALKALQDRHPFLSAYINGDQTDPVFKFTTGTEIPLRYVKAAHNTRWETEVETELATPFDWSKAPLIRATLIEFPGKSILILSSHHAVADGLSMSFLFRDLFQALAGSTLTPLPIPGSAEDFFGLDVKALRSAPVPENKRLPERRTEKRPFVESITLTTELTERIVMRARQENVTVNAVLCAAFLLAGRNISDKWKNEAVKLVVPASNRSGLQMGETCGMYIQDKAVTFSPVQQDFWELAEQVRKETTGLDTPEQAKAFTETICPLVFGDLDNQAISDILQSGIAREYMVSNLGRIAYDPDFGAFQMTGLWGPIALSGYTGDQTIGICTIQNRIHLLHVSRIPLSGLLSQLVVILDKL